MKTKTFAILASLALAGCSTADSDNPDLGDEPVQIVEVFENQHFENLDQMVASSDAVVVAEVVDVGPGEIRGAEPDGTGGIQFSETTIRIETVLSGSVDGDTLVIESLGWADYGREYAFADGSTHHVHTPGERAIFHLVRTQRPDDRVLYRLTNSQGKYVLDQAGTITATKTNDALAGRIEQMKLVDFTAQVATMATQQ